MNITTGTLSELFTGFKTIFNKAVSEYKPKWDKIATLVPSKTAEELYTWFSALPKMREWVGNKVIKKLSTEGYRIRNKSYEDTMSIPRDTIEDDQYGVYAPFVQMLGTEATRLPDTLVFELLKDGFSKKCFDEQPFFSQNHPAKGNAKQSNKGMWELTPESYGEARALMMSRLDAEGKPMNIVPSLLVVPPALEARARRILTAELVNGGESNPYKDTAELMVAPELAGSDTAWYLLCTSMPIKPFIWQERKKPVFISRIDATSDNVFSRGEYEYSAEARGGAGYTLWQLAFGSDGTKAKSGG